MNIEGITKFIANTFYIGYTPLNTTVYAFLAVFLAYFTFKLIQRLKIKMDNTFLYMLTSIIILGSSSRVMVDLGVNKQNFLNVSPGIWLFLYTLLVILVVVFRKVFGENYWKFVSIVVLILALPNYYQILIHFKNLEGFLFAINISLSIYFILLFLRENIKILENWYNFVVLFVHLFDATVTYISLDFYGYMEQHVFPNLLINTFHTGIVMYPLKLIVLIPLLYILDKEKDIQLRNFILFIVYLFGLAPGLRDLLRLACLT